MRQKFTLAVVLVFFTVCSFGQKKEIMRNNLHSTNRVKTHADVHISHGINHYNPRDRQNDFLSAKAKTCIPSDLKSAEAVKQRLDSLIEFIDTNVPSYKVDFTYNSYGNITQELYFEWDSSFNAWVNSGKWEHTYDSNGNMTQEIDYFWNSSTNAWVGSRKLDLTHDSNGNLTEEVDYDWNSSTNAWIGYRKRDYTYDSYRNMTQRMIYFWESYANAWVGALRMDYTYDSNGNMTQEIDYNWNGMTNAWNISVKYDYTYDANGNITQLLQKYWNSSNSTWVDDYKTVYTYDSYGNNTQVLGFRWDGYTTHAWIGFSKSDYTYDSNGNKTQEHQYVWDSSTNAWVDYSKYDYTYNANGNITQKRGYSWDSYTNAWVGVGYKDSGDFTYDANGNITSEIYYDWYQATSQFIPSQKNGYSYDLSYNLSDLIFPLFWVETGMMNMPLEISTYNWDTVSSSWVIDHNDVYYYTEISNTSVPRTVVSGNDIYPNPVSDYIKVSDVTGVATFNLYNLQGKLILSKTLTGDEPVNVSGLSKGAYFYNLTVDQKRQVGKLIKK